jgi:hypothetical protein
MTATTCGRNSLGSQPANPEKIIGPAAHVFRDALKKVNMQQGEDVA